MVWTDVNTAIKYCVDIFQSLTLMHDPLNPNIPGIQSTINYWCIENLGWVGWTTYLCIFQTRTWYLQKYYIWLYYYRVYDCLLCNILFSLSLIVHNRIYLYYAGPGFKEAKPHLIRYNEWLFVYSYKNCCWPQVISY